MPNRPFLILIVLDGFGCRKEREYNAIAQAKTPRFDRLFRESPWTTLEASGAAVGLPAGQMGNSEVGQSIIGRYFTMDRDKRWDRVQRGYDLMTLGVGTETKHPIETLRRFYEQGVTDEFMEPISVLTADGAHAGRVEDGDALVFFNFRADRMREIVRAFKDDDFQGFSRAVRPRISLITMNQYHEDFNLPVLFAPIEIKNHLGEVLSQAGLKQLRIAETEKYAHVTFFFNGGSDKQSAGEDRVLIPPPN